LRSSVDVIKPSGKTKRRVGQEAHTVTKTRGFEAQKKIKKENRPHVKKFVVDASELFMTIDQTLAPLSRTRVVRNKYRVLPRNYTILHPPTSLSLSLSPAPRPCLTRMREA
jgi:hypothetical protein